MGQNLITKRSRCRETLWKSYTQEQELTYTQRLNIPITSPASLQGRTLIFIPLVNITSYCFVATSSSFHPPLRGVCEGMLECRRHPYTTSILAVAFGGLFISDC